MATDRWPGNGRDGLGCCAEVPGTDNRAVCGTVDAATLLSAMAEGPIINMRARVAQSRLLAQRTTDPRAAKILLQMADEGERDIMRLEPSDTSASEHAND